MFSTVIIPCAGKGTRLYPLTKHTSKPMLELGSYKLIDYSISECLLSQFNTIIIISSPDDSDLKDHIDNVYSNNNLPYIKDIHKFNAKFIIVDQLIPKGLGDAINLATNYIKENYFGIVLPDDLLISKIPILKIMKKISAETKANILLGNLIENKMRSNFGIIETSDSSNNLYKKVDSLIEKPNVGQTDSNISVLGRYFLSKQIFKFLNNTKPGYAGEVQLTDAMITLLNEEDFYVINNNDLHYDVGSIKGFETASKYISNEII